MREVWVACLALIALLSLFAWMSATRRRHMIIDTPTSRIVSAAQGYVELSGTGRPPDPPLHSHLSSEPCLWYRWEIREGKTWGNMGSGESDVPFLLDDGSGSCVIDPEGAEILTRHKKSWMRENCRFTEWKLLIGDTIYALGEFKTISGGSIELDSRQDLNELLAAWKKDRAWLLERFDLDRDGEISEEGLARQAARREVSKMHRTTRNDPDAHTLRCPRNSRHYLLSNIDPNRLARRYLLWAIFHLSAFLIALGAIPWVLQTKMLEPKIHPLRMPRVESKRVSQTPMPGDDRATWKMESHGR